MVNSQFGAILKEFETFFNCSLQPDDNDSCFIRMGIGVNIQIELDRYGLLLIGCRLGAVHMGRYRDNLIHAALKSNELLPPSTGIFGFSQKSNQLILFIKLNPNLLSSHVISTLMPPFVAKAKLWTNAILSGSIPSVAVEAGSKVPGIFGLIS